MKDINEQLKFFRLRLTRFYVSFEGVLFEISIYTSICGVLDNTGV